MSFAATCAGRPPAGCSRATRRSDSASIREASAARPFFLDVSFNAVHAPFQVPDGYKAPYAHLQEPRRTYAGMVAAMDEAVGKIVGAIDEKDMHPNTLFIFSSDNGGPQPGKITSNGSLRAGKGTLYEGGVRVPAFATWSGQIKPGTVIDQPLHIADWYPTLLKLAGASSKQKLPLDGRDIWDTITRGAPSPHDAILLNATPAKGAIRVGDWKLILNGATPDADEDAAGAVIKGRDAVELFNLAQDPNEKTNLAEEHPDRVRALRARYTALAKDAVPPKSRSRQKDFKSPAVWGEAQ